MGYIYLVFLGIIMGFLMTAVSLDDYVEDGLRVQELTRECQKDLPRNQHCTIIAVPEQDLED